MGEDSAFMQELIALEEEYVEDMNILLMLKPASGDVFDVDTLTAIEKITEAGWQIPSIFRVDSLTNFQYVVGEDDDLIVRDLVEDPSSLSAAEREQIRSVALKDPRIVNLLVSENSMATAINMLSNVNLSSLEEVAATTGALNNLLEEIKQEHPGLEVYGEKGVGGIIR